MSFRRKDRGVKIHPADPEKRAAHQAKLEQASKDRAEVVAEIMETSVKRKMPTPVEYESKASEEAKSIIAEMEFQAFGTLPEPAKESEEKKEANTPADVLSELIEEHGQEWVYDHLAGRHE